MTLRSTSRRWALKRLAGLSVLGALNALRAPRAETAAATARLSLPGFGGKIIGRQDPDYEMWRQAMVWHLSKPERYPDLIAQARNAGDVVTAVNHAAQHRLRIGMRSGGHNSNGSALREGGMTLDVSAMDGIRIDVSKRIAHVQPGARALDLVLAARRDGLCFPVPHCPSVGLAGFTLGGGIGWNYPQRGGLATLSIAGASLVTAEGRLLQVTPGDHPDLYWAVRGAGPGFFGAVTELQLRLYPSPRAILASSWIFALDDLEAVIAEFERVRSAHDLARVEVLMVLMHHPELPADAPPGKAKICFVSAFAFEDSDAAARKALQPFAQSGLPRMSLAKTEFQPFDFEGLFERFFSLNDPAGRCARYVVDNVLTDRGGKTLLALAPQLRQAPARDCHVLAGFNMNLEPVTDACQSWAADCYVGCYGIWDEERDDARIYSWLRGCLPLMDPYATGHYVNEVEGRHPDRFRQCFSAANWDRLETLRRRYDPDGVFHGFLNAD
jgi:FAD/FMN-containing dehydrogenase